MPICLFTSPDSRLNNGYISLIWGEPLKCEVNLDFRVRWLKLSFWLLLV